MTPAPTIDDYLAELAEQRRQSPHTISNYRRDLARLLALAGALRLAELQVHQIRRFVAQLHAQGLSGRSLGRMLSAWRGFFAWLGQHNARAGQSLRRACGRRSRRGCCPKALSVDEAAALLAPNDEDDPALAVRDAAIFELFYSSGLRLAELAALDIDVLEGVLLEGEVRVLGKRSKARIVPVGTRAREALAAWRAAREQLAAEGERALFVSRRGARLSHRAIQVRLGRQALRAGMPRHVHPHMLRHSFASHVLQSSGDLRAVQEMLGHASIASTQVYTHLDFQHLAKVYDAAHPRAKR